MSEFNNRLPFVMVENGNGDYRTGEIVGAAHPEYVFVRFDSMSGDPAIMGPPVEMYHLSEMTADATQQMKAWCFFATAAERQDWIDWLESTDAPKVVRLVCPAPDQNVKG
jgi:hypothetical protein